LGPKVPRARVRTHAAGRNNAVEHGNESKGLKEHRAKRGTAVFFDHLPRQLFQSQVRVLFFLPSPLFFCDGIEDHTNDLPHGPGSDTCAAPTEKQCRLPPRPRLRDSASMLRRACIGLRPLRPSWPRESLQQTKKDTLLLFTLCFRESRGFLF